MRCARSRNCAIRRHNPAEHERAGATACGPRPLALASKAMVTPCEKPTIDADPAITQPPSIEWASIVRAALRSGPAALVTIVATEGSVPRGAGTRMLVTANAAAGTIGGGKLEHQAMAQARAILALPEGSWRIQDYPLGPLLGQCCGGRVRLLVERLASDVSWLGREEAFVVELGERVVRDPGADADPLPARGPLPRKGARFIEPADTVRLPVLMFGAGHVGQAVARLAARLPLQLGWFDNRPELAALPGVMLGESDDMVQCSSEAAADTAVVILTHDHALDYRLTAAALRSPARFVGLIGSRTKRARFLHRLADEGFDAPALARLHCPIGVAGVIGKEPEVIAVAIVAQLLGLRASE